MNKKQWLALLGVLLLAAVGWFFVSRQDGGGGTPRGGAGEPREAPTMTVERSDGFSDGRVVPAGASDAQLLGFTLKTTSTTNDVLLKSVSFAVAPTSTFPLAKVYNLRLFLDGTLVGTAAGFTASSSNTVISTAVMLPRSAALSFRLLADIRPTSVSGSLQFDLFSVHAVSSVTGQAEPVARASDLQPLSRVHPVTSALLSVAGNP